jgi:predicted nucleic acid-binding protein
MKRDLRNQNSIFSFESIPPDIAYVDPSFFINLIVKDSNYHSACKSFSLRLKAKGTILLLSNLGLDEIWFIILKLQAVKERGLKNWLNFLKDNPKKVIEYSKEISKITTFILDIPNVFLIEITTNQTLRAISLIHKYGLLPRDAIHAATAIDSGIDTIITTDPDFCHVKELKTYTCNPLN